jgi:chloride channel protein, CIC family
MREMWFRFLDWSRSRRINRDTLLMIVAVGVGAASALGVVAFYKAIDLAYFLFFHIPSEQVSRGVFAAYRPFVTALGFMTAWTLWRRIGRGAEGMNVPDVQLAVARRGGYLSLRTAGARTVASAVTLGSGGSAGSEGPVAVLGSTIGSYIGRTLKFDSNAVIVMVASGAAAGISAAFNAPLAGAFFALEEVIGAFSVAAFAPVVISSVVGAVISHAFLGRNPAFPIPQEYGYSFSSEIFLLHPLLGILCGLAAVLFIRTHFRMHEIGERFRHRPLLRAAIAGALVGMLVFLSHGVLVGYGHLAVRVEVFGRMAWYSLLLLALGKILATSITINLGGSGGVFTPSLYIGAAIGGAFGVGVHQLFPDLPITPEAYSLVGMGALVAAATDAPITGILIVFEMTNDYAIMLPLMLVVTIAWVVRKRLEPDSLYSGYLRRRGEVVHKHASADLLSTLRIDEIVEPAVPIGQNEPVSAVLMRIHRDPLHDLPVVDAALTACGMIRVNDVQRLTHEMRTAGREIIAADLAIQTDAVFPQDLLFSAVQKMEQAGVNTLPVIDASSGELLGVVTRRTIIETYQRRIEHADGATAATLPLIPE